VVSNSAVQRSKVENSCAVDVDQARCEVRRIKEGIELTRPW
jgi:hypothetical protein